MSEKQGWGNICERVDTCALTGAGAFFAAIDKSEVLINGPLWCYFYALRHLEKARPDMYTRFYGSQPDNNAVIYGSEEYVTQELQRMLEDGHKPSVLLLESSCSLSLIGDDLAGMARKLQLPFPVVTLDSGGMVGGIGNEVYQYLTKTAAVWSAALPRAMPRLPRSCLRSCCRRLRYPSHWL